jgi:hypothetical protein
MLQIYNLEDNLIDENAGKILALANFVELYTLNLSIHSVTQVEIRLETKGSMNC